MSLYLVPLQTYIFSAAAYGVVCGDISGGISTWYDSIYYALFEKTVRTDGLVATARACAQRRRAAGGATQTLGGGTVNPAVTLGRSSQSGGTRDMVAGDMDNAPGDAAAFNAASPGRFPWATAWRRTLAVWRGWRTFTA